MIQHVIRMSIRPDVSAEQVQTALARMQEVTSELTAAEAGLFGRDVGGDFDFAAVSTFKTLEEYEEMMNAPAHLAIDRLGLPLVDRFVSNCAFVSSNRCRATALLAAEASSLASWMRLPVLSCCSTVINRF